jgi:prevent-host-death family protein
LRKHHCAHQKATSKVTTPRDINVIEVVVTNNYNVVMNVSVRELKAKLSRYLKDAKAGRDVVVTSRGRPVGRLLAIPEQSAEEPAGEELLRRLKLISGVRVGNGGKPLGAKRPIKIRRGQKTLAEMVLEDRG